MANLIETSYEHILGEDTFTITAAERWSINMVHRLQKQHPESVEIVVENPDGSLLAHIPFEWMRIVPKRKTNLTEEQRELLSERMKSMRANAVASQNE